MLSPPSPAGSRWAEVGGHGVGGVAQPGDPAVVQGGERGGQVVEVVLEDVGGVEAADAVQQGRNRVVPRAEAVAEFATAYADINEADHGQHGAAIRSGRIDAVRDI